MSHVDKNVKKCNNRLNLKCGEYAVSEISRTEFSIQNYNLTRTSYFGGFIMKSTGIVRGLDKMGRIVLPVEIRKMLHLVDDKSSVEFYTDADTVILKKYVPACIFCDSADEMIEFKGIKICKSCLKKMNYLAAGGDLSNEA